MLSNNFTSICHYYYFSDTNLVEFSLEKRSLLRRCGDDKDQLFFFFFLLPPPPPRFNVPEADEWNSWISSSSSSFLCRGGVWPHTVRERVTLHKRNVTTKLWFLVRQSFLRNEKWEHWFCGANIFLCRGNAIESWRRLLRLGSLLFKKSRPVIGWLSYWEWGGVF